MTSRTRLRWGPSELGLARAYVAGEIDVDGDLARWR
jgi:cyclopropane-fatty-acyl-phospholipid synthase